MQFCCGAATVERCCWSRWKQSVRGAGGVLAATCWWERMLICAVINAVTAVELCAAADARPRMMQKWVQVGVGPWRAGRRGLDAPKLDCGRLQTTRTEALVLAHTGVGVDISSSNTAMSLTIRRSKFQRSAVLYAVRFRAGRIHVHQMTSPLLSCVDPSQPGTAAALLFSIALMTRAAQPFAHLSGPPLGTKISAVTCGNIIFCRLFCSHEPAATVGSSARQCCKPCSAASSQSSLCPASDFQ